MKAEAGGVATTCQHILPPRRLLRRTIMSRGKPPLHSIDAGATLPRVSRVHGELYSQGCREA